MVTKYKLVIMDNGKKVKLPEDFDTPKDAIAHYTTYYGGMECSVTFETVVEVEVIEHKTLEFISWVLFWLGVVAISSCAGYVFTEIFNWHITDWVKL